MAKSMGGIAFIIGLILAVLIALVSAAAVPTWAVFVMAILGVIVGLLNIQDKEINLFLVAAIAFLISFQAFGNVIATLAFGWEAVSAFFNLMSIFVAPAAAIVAIKALFRLTRD